MTKLIVVILISDNLKSHHTTEATKKVHELCVTVEPEGPHEVPKPLAAPKPHEVTEVQVSHNSQDSQLTKASQI